MMERSEIAKHLISLQTKEGNLELLESCKRNLINMVTSSEADVVKELKQTCDMVSLLKNNPGSETDIYHARAMSMRALAEIICTIEEKYKFL